MARTAGHVTLLQAARTIAERGNFDARKVDVKKIPLSVRKRYSPDEWERICDQPPEFHAWQDLLAELKCGSIVATGQVCLYSEEIYHETLEETERKFERRTPPPQPDFLTPFEISTWNVPRPGRATQTRRLLELRPIEQVSRDWWYEHSVPRELKGDPSISRAIGRGVELLRHIEIVAHQIDERWPDPERPVSTQHGDDEPLQSGAPGRPTSKHLVTQEAARRRQSGDVLKPVSAEAKALAAWLKKAHSAYPSMTHGTIENAIREEHRRHWAKPRN